MLGLLLFLGALGGTGAAVAVVKTKAKKAKPKPFTGVATFVGIGVGGKKKKKKKKKGLFGIVGLNAGRIAIGGQKAGTPDAVSDRIDAINAKMKERAKREIDALSKEAKEKGASELNKWFEKEYGVNPGISADDDFGEVFEKLSTATGAVAADALCKAYAVDSPICAKVGAIIGAYLGEKIGPWVQEAWDDVKDWFSEAGEDIEDAWDDAVDDIGDALDDGVDAVAGFFGF